MSFSIQLTPDVAGVEPGATATLTVVVVNKSDDQDRFEMEIEGIDSEWKAVPVPIFSAERDETHTEKIFFKPRRDSESLAGNYPFVVRVRSLISGNQRTAQGVLQVKAFHHLTMEISPKKGFVSPFRQQNIFEVSLMNLGNTEHTVQLLGSDPEDGCAYGFENEQVTVGPGHQRSVELKVSPTNQPLFSGGRLIGFTVTARSVDTPSIVTSSQAQLEQRSLFSPGTLIGLVIVAILFGAWLLLWPKAPTLTFSANPRSIVEGSPIQLQWVAEHASEVIIKAADEVVYDGTELSGTINYVPKSTGTLSFDAEATKDGRRADAHIPVSVEAAPAIPDPIIRKVLADPDKIKLGESFILHYGFNESVSKAVLAPLGTDLDLNINDLQITPNRAGDTQYTVVATNKNGQSVRKSVTVHVVDESDARILGLEANPGAVDSSVGHTRVSWQVTGAVRVELKPEGGNPTLVDSTGSLEMPVTHRTSFVLTAYDNKGRTVTRKLSVSFVEPKPPPAPIDTGTTAGPLTPGTAGTAGNGTSGPPPTTDGGVGTAGGATGGTTAGVR